jgi:GrpB-like predicted nucleotidyltransferase (UPF0157 family)
MESSRIEIEAYNPLWADQFEQLKALYNHYLKDSIKQVEHVGSTSVPGLAAKPILDIDLVIEEEQMLREVIPVLEQLGYTFMGDQGIKDRYAFRANAVTTPDTGTHKIWPKHHLYCCLESSISLKNHLIVREVLRTDPEVRTAYQRLKIELAQTAADIDEYVEGKSDFIVGILVRAGISEQDVQSITDQNKKK